MHKFFSALIVGVLLFGFSHAALVMGVTTYQWTDADKQLAERIVTLISKKSPTVQNSIMQLLDKALLRTDLPTRSRAIVESIKLTLTQAYDTNSDLITYKDDRISFSYPKGRALDTTQKSPNGSNNGTSRVFYLKRDAFVLGINQRSDIGNGGGCGGASENLNAMLKEYYVKIKINGYDLYRSNFLDGMGFGYMEVIKVDSTRTYDCGINFGTNGENNLAITYSFEKEIDLKNLDTQKIIAEMDSIASTIKR